MQSAADKFRSVDSVLSDLHASALADLATLNIEACDRSDRIGARGDVPFVNIEYRTSSSLRPPEIAMVMTRLGYCYPTEDSEGCSDIPVSENPLSGDRLDYDPTSDTLYVIDMSNPRKVKLVVRDFGASSDNWATSGFSNDGSYLTVGNLMRIRVFTYSPD